MRSKFARQSLVSTVSSKRVLTLVLALGPGRESLMLSEASTMSGFPKFLMVGSTGQRNGSFEGIRRRVEAKRFSWPCIEPEGDLIKVMLGISG